MEVLKSACSTTHDTFSLGEEDSLLDQVTFLVRHSVAMYMCCFWCGIPLLCTCVVFYGAAFRCYVHVCVFCGIPLLCTCVVFGAAFRYYVHVSFVLRHSVTMYMCRFLWCGIPLLCTCVVLYGAAFRCYVHVLFLVRHSVTMCMCRLFCGIPLLCTCVFFVCAAFRYYVHVSFLHFLYLICFPCIPLYFMGCTTFYFYV